MDFISSLNPAQQSAVLHTDGPLLILAGAGSGKTRVITSRMAHLIASGLATPGRVLAVTFTNKAAEEMRNRVEQLLGEDCRQIWLSTFHSLCARLLRREAPAIGLDARLRHLRLLRSALRRQAGDEDARHRRQADPAARGAGAHQPGQEPDGDAGGHAIGGWSLRDQQISKIYELYREDAERRRRARLRRPAAEDRRARRDQRADPRALRAQVQVHPGRRIPGHEPAAVHADSAPRRGAPQPLRRRRSRSVHLPLARRRPAQHPRLRARLSRTSTVVKLEQNYRSTQVILDAASAVISRNRNRKDKRLWTDQAGRRPDPLRPRAGDEIEEADFITKTIRETHGSSDARR